MTTLSERLQQAQTELAQAQARIAALEAQLAQASSTPALSGVVVDQIVQHSWDAFVLITADGVFDYVSPAILPMTGYPPEAFLGRKWAQVVSHQDEMRIRAMLESLLPLHGQHQTIVLRIQHKDGRWLSLEVSAVNHFNTPHLNAIFATVRDITERKQAEADLQAMNEQLEQRVLERTQELERTKNRLEAIFNHSGDGILVLDMNQRIQQANDVFERLFDLSPEQCIGLPLFAFVHAEDASLLDAYVFNITSHSDRQRLEVRAQRANGTLFDVELSLVPVNGLYAHVTSLVCVIRDIAERKRAEEALRESEERYRTLITTMSEGIVLQGRDHGLRAWNAAAGQILGLTADELSENVIPSPKWYAIETDGRKIALDKHPIMTGIIESTSLSNKVIGIHKPDDTITWISINTRPVFKPGDPQPDAMVITLSDVTQRIEAENALQRKLEDEQQLQKYFQILHEIAIELTQIVTLDDFYRSVVTMGLERLGFDRMGFFLYDARYKRALGTYGTDLQGHVRSERHITFEPSPTGGMWKAMQQPNQTYLTQNTELFHDQEVIGRGWHATVAVRYGDRITGWIVVDNVLHRYPVSKGQLDILGQYGIYIAATLARRQAEAALQKTKDQLQAILDYSTASIFMKDLEGHVMLLNRKAEIDLGLSADQATSQAHEMPGDQVPEYFQRYDTTVKELRQPIGYEEVIKGRTYWITKFPIFDDQDRIYALGGITTDITNLKHYEASLERALRQEKELSDLKSRFVSVASHEFRTPLASILAMAETLLAYRERLDSNQIDSRLDRIRQQVLHMRDIIEDVMNLARLQGGTIEMKPTWGNLDLLCRELIEDFHSHTEYQNRIRYLCLEAPVLLNFDGRLIRQAISNLIMNALKYSPHHTPVTVTLMQSQMQVSLRIEDKGIGIPSHDLKHLFEPFHRATNVGTIPGTGLGLSIAKQFIELHGGHIDVESEEGVGTVLTITFQKEGNAA